MRKEVGMSRDEIVVNTDAILSKCEAAFQNGADSMEDMAWNAMVKDTLHAAASLLRDDAATLDALRAENEELRGEAEAAKDKVAACEDTERLDAVLALAKMRAERLKAMRTDFVNPWGKASIYCTLGYSGEQWAINGHRAKDPRVAIDAAATQLRAEGDEQDTGSEEVERRGSTRRERQAAKQRAKQRRAADRIPAQPKGDER